MSIKSRKEILREVLARKQNPLSDIRMIQNDREMLSWWNTNTLDEEETTLLNEILN